jgi:hypothetical protein
MSASNSAKPTSSSAKSRLGAQSLEKARLQLSTKQQLNLIHPSATVFNSNIIG